MLKKIFFTILIIIDIFAVSISLFLRYLSNNTHTDPLYFPKLLWSVKKSPTLSPGFNFMILGLDPRNDSLEKTETTDTIIFGNLSPNLKINLISLPRDLWDYSLNTKINQIYPLSIGQTNQFDYIQKQYQQLTSQKIDRTVVITTQNLIDLVHFVGGVDVYLDKGFKDEEYPNPDYIASPSAKISKYITIEFPQGNVHLEDTNVTEFVRSRKSADTAVLGGTDIGRIERQQLLINALLAKFKSPEFYQQPQNIFNLYKFFHSDLQTNFTDSDIFSLGLKAYRKINQITLNKVTPTTGENPKTDLLYHPQTFINRQWVFIPQDKDYSRFQKFIADTLRQNQ
jgi:LCP family protein required for cell wall assembly